MTDIIHEHVLPKLEKVRKSPGGWTACCPAHDDRNPSLSVRPGDRVPVVLHCFAGCTADAVAQAAGIPLWALAPLNGRSSEEWTPRGPAVAVYHYCDERGELLFDVCRTADKQFPQRRPDPAARSGWVWKLGDVRRVPYRLPELIAAAAAAATVYVTEGERDVHSAERAGVVGTTFPGGAGKWRREYAPFFEGAHVVVVADRDEPGYRHAYQVADGLRRVAASVRVVEPATGKDLSDHLAAGRTVAELAEVPAARLAELAERQAGNGNVARLDQRRRGGSGGSGGRGGSGAPPTGGTGDGGKGDAGRSAYPSHEISMSSRRGSWYYSLGDDGWPRGVYEGTTPLAPLPYCHALVVRRDGTGQQIASEFLVSAAEDGPRKMVGHSAVHDGSWANELGLALSDDPTVVQAAATAIRDHAHNADVPEREAVPRIGESGRVSVPVPECLPGGYLVCAPGDRDSALAGWRAIAAIVGQVPKLAAVLGASVFAVFLLTLRRQTWWCELFGEAGQGKTTALTLAAGVWGNSVDPGHAVRLSWNDTAIGLGRHLGSLGILPAFLDEQGMAHFSPSDWGELIFKTCEGNQRLTAEYKTAGTRRSLPWGGVLFTSGNGRVTAGLGAGKYAGLVRRVVSIAAPFTRSAAEAEALVGTDDAPGLVERCYGHLGAEILARFGAADARRFLADCGPLVGMLPEDAVPRTLAKHLHAAVAGAAMADEVLGMGTALQDAAAKFAREYLAEHGVTPEHDADRIISAVREAIAREPARWPTKAEYAEHLKPRADGFGAEPGRTDLPQRGMAREFAGVRADDGSWVAIFPEPFHDELVAKLGVDEGLALAELFRRGVLLVAKSWRARGDWQTPVRLEPKPAGPVPMYKLIPPEVGDDDDEVTGQPTDNSGDSPITESNATSERDSRPRAREFEADSPHTPQTPQVRRGLVPQTSPQTRPKPRPKPPPEIRRQEPLSAREPTAGALPGAPGFVTASERFAAPAVVADADGGYLARPDRLEALELPRPFRNLAHAVGWALTLKLGVDHGKPAPPDDAVLVILPDLATRLGLPKSPPADGSKAAREHPALEPLRAAGWTVGELGSWMRVWRQGGRTVRVWLPAWDDYGTCPMWDYDQGVPAITLAYRLGLFAERLGIGWRLTGGITGVDLSKMLPRRTLRLESADPPQIAFAPLETEILWSRKPEAHEAGLSWLHCYDGNSAYASPYNTPVNVGGWRRVEVPEFDPKLPGYWLAELPAWADRLLPDPADPTGRDARTGRRAGPVWRATPTLAILGELGYEVQPREAWLPDGAYGRYWEGWYERVRDARAAVVGSADPDDQAVLEAIKAVVRATHGQITTASQGKRRDHDHTIIAAYRANLIRRVVKVADAEQRWPLAIATDNVAYASADPDPCSACPAGIVLGTALGQFKVAGSLPMADAASLLGTSRSADLTDAERGLFALARKHLEGSPDGS